MDNGFHSSIMTETIENKQREHLIFRVTLVGSFINFLLLLFKFVAGVLGGSAAMIADAVHSLSDFVTDLIVVLFVRISGKPCDADHDFGHGKYETLATASIGLMLLAVGLGILWNGASEIIAYIKGDNIAEPGLIALVAALVSVISKEFLFQWTARVGRRVDSAVVVANAWHHRSDALSSIGTAVGIGGAILLGPSWRILDPIAAVIVSLFIARVAFKLFVPSIQELLEKSLPEDEEQFIINVINETDGASLPHCLRTRRIGNNRAIDVHFCMDGNTTLQKANEASRAVERKLRQKFGKQTFITTHVEPLEIPYVPPTDR